MLNRRDLMTTTAMAAAGNAVAADDPTAGKSNKVLAREYYLVIDKDGLEAGHAYGGPASKYHGANHTQFEAKDGPSLGRAYYTAFPDFTHVIIEQVGEGEIVVERIRYFATHSGRFMGIAATGKKITFTGMDWVRFENGKAVERWGVADELEIRRQLLGEPSPRQTQINKALAREYYEAIDRFGTGAAGAYGGEGSQYHGSNYQGMGKTTPHYTAFPDYTHLIHEQIAEDDIVVERIQYFGTHRDWFQGIAPTAKTMSYTGMDWVKYKDTKSIARWGVADGLGVRRQLLGEDTVPAKVFDDWPQLLK